MPTRTVPSLDKTVDTEQAVDRGHAVWKRNKIERALAEAQDRSVMIPAETVWRDLGLEG